jgi:hypothetical protein
MNKREIARERKAFEAWGRRDADFEDDELEKDQDGGYVNYNVDFMWIGWMARADVATHRESAP